MDQCSVLKVQNLRGQEVPFHAGMVLDSSMVEHSAVNRVVVGSSPTRGVKSAARRTLKSPQTSVFAGFL